MPPKKKQVRKVVKKVVRKTVAADVSSGGKVKGLGILDLLGSAGAAGVAPAVGLPAAVETRAADSDSASSSPSGHELPCPLGKRKRAAAQQAAAEDPPAKAERSGEDAGGPPAKAAKRAKKGGASPKNEPAAAPAKTTAAKERVGVSPKSEPAAAPAAAAKKRLGASPKTEPAAAPAKTTAAKERVGVSPNSEPAAVPAAAAKKRLGASPKTEPAAAPAKTTAAKERVGVSPNSEPAAVPAAAAKKRLGASPKTEPAAAPAKTTAAKERVGVSPNSEPAAAPGTKKKKKRPAAAGGGNLPDDEPPPAAAQQVEIVVSSGATLSACSPAAASEVGALRSLASGMSILALAGGGGQDGRQRGAALLLDGSDSESDVEADFAFSGKGGAGGRKDVIDMFIAQRSEFYLEPEVIEATGAIREGIQTLLAERKQEKADEKAAETASPTAGHNSFTPGGEGFATVVNLAAPGEAGEAAEKVNLPLDRQYPPWVTENDVFPTGEPNPLCLLRPAATAAQLQEAPVAAGKKAAKKRKAKLALEQDASASPPPPPWASDRAACLHAELLCFASWARLSKAAKKQKREAGKSAVAVILGLDPAVSTALVGSLASRTATRWSAVDVAVWRASTPTPPDSGAKPSEIDGNALKNRFESLDGEWTVVSVRNAGEDGAGASKGVSGIHTIEVLHEASGETVMLRLNDPTLCGTADFVSGRRQQFGTRFLALSWAARLLLAQRRIAFAPCPHVVHLLCICYLQHKAAAARAADGPSAHNLGSLLVDFFSFLAHRANAYTVVFNPADPTGRCLSKWSLSLADSPYLYVVDPVTKANAARNSRNWAMARDVFENAVALLAAGSWPAAGDASVLHSHRPEALQRPTLLSRVINPARLP
ncbi:hypothetical protein DIPPA_35072 [Diplonema papillatum]|nr:hypothetical protein DIPPA_35072 [Diplonema papillatum]